MTVVLEDFSPVYVGDTGAIFAPQFQHRDNSPVDLSYAAISMKMVNGNTTKTCSGAWIIDDAPGGIAHYQYQAADVNTAGFWTLYITITTNGFPIHSDTKTLEIRTAP